MLAYFGLACEIPPVGNDLDTVDGSPLAPSYLVPWFFKANRPRSVSNDWPSQASCKQVGALVLRVVVLRVLLRVVVLRSVVVRSVALRGVLFRGIVLCDTPLRAFVLRGAVLRVVVVLLCHVPYRFNSFCFH